MPQIQDIAHTSLPGTWSILNILKTSRQAFQPTKVLLAFLGLLATLLIGWGLDWIWLASDRGLEPAALASSPLLVQPVGKPIGPFDAFLDHEKYCVDQILKAARKFQFFGEMGDVWGRLLVRGGSIVRPSAGDGYGALAFAFAMVQGAAWMLRNHWFFATVSLLSILAIWSLFGGAICRISAMEFARDEWVPMSDALAYSRQRFLHMFLAPVLLIAGAGFVGLAMIAGGWVASWDYVGWLFGGPFFFLALIGGAIIAAIAVIATTSFTLLWWPSIAADGLDATEALGRSTTYFFHQLERAVVYALVTLIYGALIWLLVRGGTFLMLCVTHGFVSVGFPALDQIWQAPTFDALYAVPASADQLEGGGRHIAAVLIRMWVGLTCLMMYGYLASFFFTGCTIIYYLLRFHVDEIELDEVYDEMEEDDEPSEIAASAGGADGGAGATAGSGEAGLPPSGGSGSKPEGGPNSGGIQRQEPDPRGGGASERLGDEPG